jgi:DNA repair exonuclease SbcCD nuclease subunit
VTTIITADIHISARPQNKYRLKLFEWLAREIKARAVKDLIIIGDITDTKDEHGSWLVNTIADHLTALSKLCFITIATGNHDYVNSELPFFEFVRHIPNIDWVHTPRVDKYKDLGHTLILPHDHSWKMSWPQWLDAEHDTCLTHCAIKGATGYFDDDDCVPAALFRNQGRVIAGDNHVPQTFDNITYVGAPYTINFGDDYQGRVLLVDRGRYEDLYLSVPQKRLIVGASIKEINEASEWLIDGDVVRVKFKLKPSQREHWRDIKADIENHPNFKGCRIEVLPESDKAAPRRKAGPVDTRNDEELVRAYCKNTGATDTVEERGLFLLRKAPQ